MSQVDWAQIPYANEDAKSEAMALILTPEGERLTTYDGGWLNLADSVHTSESKWSVSADTRSHITIDGLGAASTADWRRGVPVDVWGSDTFNPSAVGEAYSVRLTMTLSKAVSSAAYVECVLGIGAGWNTDIARIRQALIKGSGTDDKLTFQFNIFCLDTFGRYGGRFYITASEDVLIWDKAMFIQRTFTP